MRLTRGLLGRRANPQNPEASLFLLKASGQVAHEGGPRFGVQSDEYRILRSWIADGMRLEPLAQRTRAPAFPVHAAAGATADGTAPRADPRILVIEDERHLEPALHQRTE